ncbi:hypothetical protein WME75_45895 [Sorangium sp. So ce1014]|uniref:hypothetical protein n=1 Tax=Sorangium sp. So ce1014 TaxID=3133326 RepID=UPI003F5DDC54
MMISLQSDAVYVAIGRIAQSELKKIVSPVVVDDDNLLLGPSSSDPRRHRAARTGYWGRRPSAKLSKELARSADLPICVAIPPTINGLLSLCRICASGAERKRQIKLIALRSDIAVPFPHGQDPTEEAFFDVADALRRNPTVTECSELEVALLATVWKLWCERSPVALSRLCAAGGALHPQLANLGCYHAGYFPRRVDKKLLLSRFDELLLRQLSGEWITSTRVFVNGQVDSPGLREWLSHVGDLYVPRRLLEWSRHGGGRLVEYQEHPEKPSEMNRWSFRWHAGGEAILESLPSLRAAPPVSIGGCVAYDADRAWVCRFDGRGSPYITRLARADGPVGGLAAR